MNKKRIKLTEDLYLRGYPYGFMIERKHISKKNEEAYTEEAYFHRLDYVFHYLVRNEIKGDITILENLEKVFATQKLFTDLWDEIKDEVKTLYTN